MDSAGSHGIHVDEQNSYWSLIKATSNLYPGFVENFKLQDAEQRDRGRAAVLEFPEGTKAHITDFGDDGEALDRYLRDHANELDSSQQTPTTQHRRLFLLEDLGRNKVQTLGTRLRIPPAFFAAHWIDPSEGHLTVDHDFLSHKRSKYFRCRVPQLHSLVQEGQESYLLGLYEPLNTNIQRYLQLLDKERGFESSQHQISFWSMSIGKDSWTGKRYTMRNLCSDTMMLML